MFKFPVVFAALLGISAAIGLGLWLGQGSSADAAPPAAHEIPDTAIEVAPDVYYLGAANDAGLRIEGYAFVRRAAPAKPDGLPGGGNGNGGGGEEPASDCFSYLANGAAWAAGEAYLLDNGNLAGLTPGQVDGAFDAGAGQWNGVTALDALGARGSGQADVASIGVATNNVNEAAFAPIANSGVIGVTYVWGIFRGPPSGRSLVEWDMILDDDGDWDWRTDGTFTSGDGIYTVDLGSVVTHELGHAIGLGHAPDTCTQETMFRSYGEGETHQRTIHDGDIAGAQSLYGAQ
jgi:hypothetical protein